MLLARCAVAFMGEYLYICFRFLPMRRKPSTTLGMPSLIFWYQRRKQLRPSLCFNTFWSFNGTYIERQMSSVQTIKTECADLYIEGIHPLTLIFYCLLLIKCLSPIRVLTIKYTHSHAVLFPTWQFDTDRLQAIFTLISFIILFFDSYFITCKLIS